MNDISASILTEVRIPFMGSVENARIQHWSAKEGARLTPDDVLCEIETDKTVMEINAPDSGILARRVVDEGADLKVGELIGYFAPLEASAEQVARALAALDGEKAPACGSASEGTTARVIEPVRISPYARRLAVDLRIDLARVTGTGAGGRITGDDVLRASDTPEHGGTVPHASIGTVTAPVPTPVPADVAAPAADGGHLPSGYEGMPHEVITHTLRRSVIARRLAETARTVPHLTADVQIDMSTLLTARKAYNAVRAGDGQGPVSVLAFLAKAACAALKDHASLNATYTETGLIVWKVINLGIAVDTPDGLVVPVIRNAGHLSIGAMDDAIKELAERARAGSLTPHDLQGGSFTISNPGSLGPVLRAEAILNAPQVALLGFPAIQHVPVAVADGTDAFRTEVRPVLRPSLTFDHRPLDGSAVVRFLGDYKRRLETMVFDW